MRAVYLTKQIGPDGLMLGDVPQPSAGKDEVLIRVHATAVTPTEFQWEPTFSARSGEPRPFPIILSHEFSGVVKEVGNAVRGLSVGTAVYGMNDWYANGAQAEYCVAPAASVAPKPKLDHAEAAVVPISALTAWQGLFERGRLKAGERVLIHGGAGGVGVFAVQFAHWRGAHVIATASKHNRDFVRSLGSDEVIDYQTTPFEKVARDLDVVFDAVGGETLDRSWGVLRAAGRLVTIAAQSEALKEARVRHAFFIVEPNQGQLAEISKLLDSGRLRAFVEAVFGLEQARDAYARAKGGGMRGKIALLVRNGN
jgi:NADPH:quinone reductase-like Zn-dependent oxidoreductase